MPLDLADHVLAFLQLQKESSDADLEEVLKRIPHPVLDVIYSEEGNAALLSLATVGSGQMKLSIYPAAHSVDNWTYHQVLIDGNLVAEVVHTPGTRDTLPSTDAERLLVKAWNWSPQLISLEDNRIIRNAVVVAWVNTRQPSEEHERSVESLFCIGGKKAVAAHKATWTTASRINIRSNARILDSARKNTDLLRLANIEQDIRWKFLGFYRVLEYGYLKSVLESLERSFFRSPKSALAEAQESIGTEINQFINLIETCGLISYFDRFVDVADKLRMENNQFCSSLERQWDKETRKPQFSGKFKKGAYLCYQVRCAIVHAGDISLLYESFDDADMALLAFAIPLEEAITEYLGFEIVS